MIHGTFGNSVSRSTETVPTSPLDSRLDSICSFSSRLGSGRDFVLVPVRSLARSLEDPIGQMDIVAGGYCRSLVVKNGDCAFLDFTMN